MDLTINKLAANTEQLVLIVEEIPVQKYLCQFIDNQLEKEIKIN